MERLKVESEFRLGVGPEIGSKVGSEVRLVVGLRVSQKSGQGLA